MCLYSISNTLTQYYYSLITINIKTKIDKNHKSVPVTALALEPFSLTSIVTLCMTSLTHTCFSGLKIDDRFALESNNDIKPIYMIKIYKY